MQAADFEKVLRTRSRASTDHFAVHHLVAEPIAVSRVATKAGQAELSTARSHVVNGVVDDIASIVPDVASCEPVKRAAATVWLGAVVPKRHARRSVTRTLLKRQIRAVIERHRDALPAGLWVIRLRAPFDRSLFPSASSNALRCLARTELEAVVARAAGQAATPPSVRTMRSDSVPASSRS